MITTVGRWICAPVSTELFPLGTLRITPFAHVLLDNLTIAIATHRHSCGQWSHPDGLLACAEEEANEHSLALCQRGIRTGELRSRYRVITRKGNLVDIALITTVGGDDPCTWICLWMES